jgi:hypothetical protein
MGSSRLSDLGLRRRHDAHADLWGDRESDDAAAAYTLS